MGPPVAGSNGVGRTDDAQSITFRYGRWVKINPVVKMDYHRHPSLLDSSQEKAKIVQ